MRIQTARTKLQLCKSLLCNVVHVINNRAELCITVVFQVLIIMVMRLENY